MLALRYCIITDVSFRLQCNSLGELGGRYLARGLLKNTCLKSLDIAANGIPPKVATLVARAAALALEGRSFALDIPVSEEAEESGSDKLASVSEILATAFT